MASTLSPRSPWEVLQIPPCPVYMLPAPARTQLFDLLAAIAWGGAESANQLRSNEALPMANMPVSLSPNSPALFGAPSSPPLFGAPSPVDVQAFGSNAGTPEASFREASEAPASAAWPAPESSGWPGSDVGSVSSGQAPMSAAGWPGSDAGSAGGGWPEPQDALGAAQWPQDSTSDFVGFESSAPSKSKKEKKSSKHHSPDSGFGDGAPSSERASRKQHSPDAGFRDGMMPDIGADLGRKREKAGRKARDAMASGRDAMSSGRERLSKGASAGPQAASSASNSAQSTTDKLAAQTAAAQKKLSERMVQGQEKVAQAAVNNYAKQASGGLITNVPAPVAKEALAYGKKNPKQAMGFMKKMF